MEKLIRVQNELKAPKNQYNKFGKYSYRSAEDILEAVKPLLVKEGLLILISDEALQVGNRIYIRATVTILDNDNQVFVQALAREPETQKGMSEPQITGSASSYARKYALNGMFCIDDTKDADTQDNTKEPQKKEATKEVVWLSEAQFKAALASDRIGIEATLKTYGFKNGKGISKDYKVKLEAKLKELDTKNNTVPPTENEIKNG